MQRGKNLKKVGALKCLDFTITSDARCNTEIKGGIALSKDTFTETETLDLSPRSTLWKPT